MSEKIKNIRELDVYKLPLETAIGNIYNHKIVSKEE